jgi:hypothetical protein
MSSVDLWKTFEALTIRGRVFNRMKTMQPTDTKKIFTTWHPPARDATRRGLVLDLDAQVVGVIERWATDHQRTLSVVLDQVATVLASEINAAAHPAGNAAQPLRILDLIDRILIGESIRPARDGCGKPCPSAYPQSLDSHAPAVPGAGLGVGNNVEAPAPAPDRTRTILDYYVALTGNRLKAADYTNVKLVLDLPDLVIQCGILHALNYATRPVGSFAYCVRAMENFLGAHLDLEATCATLIDKLLRKRATGQLVLPLAGEKLLIGEFQNDD